MEICLDEGYELPKPYGTEFDLDNLLRMDSATMMATIQQGITAGVLAPNEGRHLLNRRGVEGGDSPMMQQQVFALAALAERDRAKPFAKPPEAAPAVPAEAPMPPVSDDAAKFAASLFTKVAAFDYAA
jgi:hypothetical protein